MEPFPGPPPWPLVGNLFDLDLKNTIQSWLDLAGVHGPIYKLRLRGADRIFITGYELINEICSRKDFVKRPLGVIKALREATPEGLLTADYDQNSWESAHRTLVPVFGPLSIRNMFDEMHDICTQMVLRWARLGEDNPIDVAADFTRLTLDTIAVCAMDTRFNSFYTDSLHPFVGSMIEVLSETQLRSVRPPWLSNLFWKSNQAFDNNRKLMHDLATKVISRRRANPSNKKDLVNAMLEGIDPITGKRLSDQVIVDNMITFLVAGHETTSGLLSFLFAMLLQNPRAYIELQREVDNVLGCGAMSVDHLNKLPYTKACLRETLRLHSPVAGFALCPKPGDDAPFVLGGKYEISPNAGCMILLGKMHRDSEIYGDDAQEFRPERMLEEQFRKLPTNAYKPFGHGSRACIGSDFAMQEAMIATAILIQKFDFKYVDPTYTLSIRQTATLKPQNLYMYATLRPRNNVLSLQRDLFHSSTLNPQSEDDLASCPECEGKPLGGPNEVH